MPVVETRPPVTASPCSCVAASSSPHVKPASARTVFADASTSMPFIARRSMQMPASTTAEPVTPWPPP